jgi:protein-S-isoprenylcysteine O-methyltransferase Ste14
MMKAGRDRTGIVIPPPILFGAPLIAGWLVNRQSPWPLTAYTTIAIGMAVVLIAFGAGVALAGVRRFRRAGTTVLPFGGTSQLVSSGIYRFTRNPMYLGMALTYAGLALLLNSVWCLLLLPVALVSVHVLAIRPEERYLSEKFGEEYRDYRTRVRRWI